ncbi:MAG TPA: hypothetical protein PLY61_17195 [Anaerohalosphaeraceae bacterium]|jgi:hypothetical protein|nr:hypothetical protein [Anaerohalosphaeraceae bacterium]
MEIKPFVGIGGLFLGMSKEDVRRAMGEPDDRSVQTHEGDNSRDETWEYSETGLDATFSSVDDWVLGSITVKSQIAELQGLRLVGMTEQDYLEKVRDAGMILQLEDDFRELGSRDYSCDAMGLSFWVHDGVLQSITIYPKYDESGDTPLWPKV